MKKGGKWFYASKLFVAGISRAPVWMEEDVKYGHGGGWLTYVQRGGAFYNQKIHFPLFPVPTDFTTRCATHGIPPFSSFSRFSLPSFWAFIFFTMAGRPTIYVLFPTFQTISNKMSPILSSIS